MDQLDSLKSEIVNLQKEVKRRDKLIISIIHDSDNFFWMFFVKKSETKNLSYLEKRYKTKELFEIYKFIIDIKLFSD